MGGGYYEADDSEPLAPRTAPVRSEVIHTSAATGYSAQAEEVLGQSSLHAEMEPLNRTVICRHKSPVVVAIDVTGSMGNWSKIIYDKLPMFYGQIMMQGYLEDPSICFLGVGDANSDEAPLQVGEFCQGAALDNWIAKLWLEGKGGGQNHETYELAGYFAAQKMIFDGATNKPFLFFTGDEGFYPCVLEEHIAEIVDESYAEGNVPSDALFRDLRDKFHVFLLHKPYFDAQINEVLRAKWEAVIGGEHILELTDAKSVIDVMLGAIAMVSGTRTIDQYMVDLDDRGQSSARKSQVAAALSGLSTGNTTLGSGPAAGGAAPAQTPAGDDEVAAMKAELAAAKKEIEMLRMRKELEAAKAEIARMKSGK